MTLRHTTKDTGDYLLVTLEGENLSVEEMLGYIDSFIVASSKIDSDLVLLDHTKLEFQMPSAQAFELASLCIDRMDTEYISKVALVVRPERMEVGRVFETVSVNQGIDLKVFDHISMASSWLKTDTTAQW